MLDRQRREHIVEYLRRETYASVHELAATTEASETTIRRDLAALESDGSVSRIHGGAAIATELRPSFSPPREEPLERRMVQRREAKRSIAEAASRLCRDGETIFIDGGSTTFAMVEFLNHHALTIVTNSFAIAEELTRRSSSTVILTGGIVNPESRLVLDPFAEDAFGNYQATLACMGVGGITAAGAFNNDATLIRSERSMIRHASRLVVLADSSKLGKSAPLRLCAVSAIGTFITDTEPPTELHEALLSAGVRVITV